MDILSLIEKLKNEHNLTDAEYAALTECESANEPLAKAADEVRRSVYGDEVYIRGLIEFTNYCKNNCYYCGIRCDNKNAQRYRLSHEQILDCCREGYSLGFRTFVLQGGEDPYFTYERLERIVADIHGEFPDCAVTLSVGERSYESYERLFRAGAKRYLLRHETALDEHYKKLHPECMSLDNRKECLFNLKKIGYQTGSGFMVGSPYQTTENLVADIRFLQELNPAMIGIGPYIHHDETPFAGHKDGSVELTLRLISILRLTFPKALIPATTALGTLHPQGRELGLKAGANVVMPNLSPTSVRKLYDLYENKICTGDEAAQCINCLSNRVKSAGYRIVTDIGNSKVTE